MIFFTKIYSKIKNFAKINTDQQTSTKNIGQKSYKKKYRGQNKGHANCVQLFLSSIKEGEECPIPFKESYLSMLATFKVLQSITENRKIEITSLD